MNEPANYIIWGSSGHAKVLASLISLCGGKVVALFDNNQNAVSVLLGVPLYIGKDGFRRWYEEEADNRLNMHGLVAIGGARGCDRLAVHEYFRTFNIPICPVVHPDASVCTTASFGPGTQVLANSVVASDSHLGEACIVNHRASADHECILGNGVHLAPGATLCGCVTIGNNVMIGAGAVILPRVKIGENTIVGAGAVVTRDLPAGIVAIGNPAKIIRKNT